MPYISSNTTATTAPHSTNAALRSESPYQQRTTQRDNPTQQLIKQAVDFLLQQLEAGKSETLTAYLAAMARFHAYSFGNILAIARQRPSATRIAGFYAWKELGRFVKRGEKGIQILAPMVGQRRRKDNAERTSSTDDNPKPQPVLIGFRAVYVFDVAQTEGADLPEVEHSITGEVGAYRDRLIEFLAQQNIALEYTENIAPALGVSYGGRIAILPGQSPAEDLVCLVHELSHLCSIENYVAYDVCCVITAGFLLFRRNITGFSLQHESVAGTSDWPSICGSLAWRGSLDGLTTQNV